MKKNRQYECIHCGNKVDDAQVVVIRYKIGWWPFWYKEYFCKSCALEEADFWKTEKPEFGEQIENELWNIGLR